MPGRGAATVCSLYVDESRRTETRLTRWLLEALLQGHIPDSPPDIGRPLVVAVFEVARDKRRILVEHVVHAKCDRGVIEPCPPPTLIVLRGRDWHDILSLAVCHRDVLILILGIAGNLLGGPLRKVKRVVDDQIQRRPFTDFASRITIVAHLTNEVDGRASIKTAEIVKHARIPPVLRERAKSWSYEPVVKIKFG